MLFYEIVPRDLDQIDITYPSHSYPGDGKVMYTITGTNLFSELDAIMEFKADDEDRGVHGCSGSARILFIRKGKVKGSWGFAHGTFFYAGWTTHETDKRLADWFATKGVKEFQEWVAKGDGHFPAIMPTFQAGLHYLMANQNTDGSWGDEPSRVFMTSFALLAFLNHGDTTNTLEYADAIGNGFIWLEEKEPTNELDRVSMIQALTAGCLMMKDATLGKRASELAQGIDLGKLDEPQRTLLMITRPPDIQEADATVRKKSEALNVPPTLSANPALNFYLQTLSVFVKGGRKWQHYNRNIMTPLVKTRREDGSLCIEGASSPVEATTFSLLALSVCYRFWNNYLDLTVTKIRGG